MQLELLGEKIEKFEAASAKKRDSIWQDVLREGSELNPHANCIRSLIRLYVKDPAAANQAIAEARKLRRTYLDTKRWNDTP
jgi:antirestriction protein ArdC